MRDAQRKWGKFISGRGGAVHRAGAWSLSNLFFFHARKARSKGGCVTVCWWQLEYQSLDRTGATPAESAEFIGSMAFPTTRSLIMPPSGNIVTRTCETFPAMLTTSPPPVAMKTCSESGRNLVRARRGNHPEFSGLAALANTLSVDHIGA